MHTYNLRCEMLVRQPISQVFKVFEEPRNLAKITPKWLNFEVLSKGALEMRKGAAIEYNIHLLGVPMHWKSLISEYEPPFQFVDEQVLGPYKYWRHTHTFRPTQEGTIVADSVDYALPLDPFSRIAHTVMVRPQLMAIFSYRQAALTRIFDGSAIRLVEPVIVSK